MVTNHEDILIRTLSGLEDDLDELRAALVRQIEAFEGGIKQRVKELPVWLTLPYARIKHIIRFPQDSSFHEALLGPRAVALAAGEIEHFVHTWVGTDGEPADLTRISQSNIAHPWGRDASLMTLYLDNLEHEAQAVMIAARAQLMHMRDEILAELEEQRRVDCEALEELVSRGDLEQGQQARKEIAELWEDQRRRADTFSRRWEGLERHVEHGLDITESGLDTLRDLLDNAKLGLSQAYPSHPAEEEEEVAPDEEFLPDDIPTHDALQVLTTQPPDSLDFDFDPYGEEKEEPIKEPIPVASASPSTTGRTRINEDFFKSDEVNDDLIFANESQLDGPMIDFGDEEPEAQSASHQLFSSTLETSTTQATQSSSPYEIFLSDDSDVSYQDHPVAIDPPLAKPSRSPEQAPRPPEEPSSQETPPRPAEPIKESPYPRLALAEQELEEDSTPNTVVALPPSVTLPYAPAPTQDSEPEVAVERFEVDDASVPTAPMIEELDTPTAPPMVQPVEELDTPTMPAGGWSEEADVVSTEELEVETVEIARELDTESSIEPVPAVEEEVEAEAHDEPIPSPNPPSVEEPPDEPERLPDTPADTEDWADELHWQAEAVRKRLARRPVSGLELGLAVGAPLILVLVLVMQAALAPDVASRLLVSNMWARGLAFGACIWVCMGPMFFLQWKMGWRGARPVPCRVQTLRDEAELIIAHDVLEVGEDRIEREEILETSLERWEDHDLGTSGLKYCVVRSHKRTLVFICTDAEDMPSHEVGHPLPRVERPDFDAWDVSELTLSQIIEWAGHEA